MIGPSHRSIPFESVETGVFATGRMPSFSTGIPFPTGEGAPVVAQFGLRGLLELASLFAPSLALAGLACLLYWFLTSTTTGVLPRVVHERGRPSPFVRLVLATPFVLAVLFVFLAFLRQPLGYWGFFLLVVGLTGMINGALLVQTVVGRWSKLKNASEKLSEYLPVGGDGADDAGESSFRGGSGRTRGSPGGDQRGTDRRSSRPGPSLETAPTEVRSRNASWTRTAIDRVYTRLDYLTRKAMRHRGGVAKFVQKRYYEAVFGFVGLGVSVVVSTAVFLVAWRTVEESLRVAEYVLTTFTSINGVVLLVWKLSKLRVEEENEGTMDETPLLGLLLLVLGASTIRIPDYFVPGHERIRSLVAPYVRYPERTAEAFLTLPVYDVVVLIVQQVGFLVGLGVSVYLFRRARKRRRRDS